MVEYLGLSNLTARAKRLFSENGLLPPVVCMQFGGAGSRVENVFHGAGNRWTRYFYGFYDIGIIKTHSNHFCNDLGRTCVVAIHRIPLL